MAGEERQEYVWDWPHEQEYPGIEDPSFYNKGGFHPVHLGDVLDDRYEVVDKLGNGSFGNVWLCQDRKLVKWRAVKILKAHLPDKGGDAKIIPHLKNVSTIEELESHHIAVPFDEFWTEGPNGRHLCLVMPILGFSVDEWRLISFERTSKDAESRTRNVCRQIAKAIRFLHEKGVGHNDIKPNNILMRIDNDALDKLNMEQMLELRGTPFAVDIRTVSGKDPRPIAPKYSVSAREFNQPHHLTDEVAIIDFGESFLSHDPVDGSGIPACYGAPEILLNMPPSLGSDIWSLACTMYQIRSDEQLFEQDYLQTSHLRAAVKGIEMLLGPLPPEYRSAWFRNRYHMGFRMFTPAETGPVTCPASTVEAHQNWLKNRQGYPDVFSSTVGKRRTTGFYSSSTQVNTTLDEWTYSREESLSLGDLLSKILKYFPEERIDAAGVCAHPWLADIPPVPALEKAELPIAASPARSSVDKPVESPASPTRSHREPSPEGKSPATEYVSTSETAEAITTEKPEATRENPLTTKSPVGSPIVKGRDVVETTTPKRPVSALAKTSSKAAKTSAPVSPTSPLRKVTRSGRSYGN